MTEEAKREIRSAIGVLSSGGLDSAILIGELVVQQERVQPMYVRFGLYWEEEEEAGLRRFLKALETDRALPLKVFECPIQSVYGEHWSTLGKSTPDADSDDSAVYLPGRNLLLLSQAAIWCSLQGIPSIALGVLKGNPFSDATDEYFSIIERGINLALGGKLKLIRPYHNLKKEDVLRRGKEMPLWATMSCLRPISGKHCGVCNKCAERMKAFSSAGIEDPSEYASLPNG